MIFIHDLIRITFALNLGFLEMFMVTDQEISGDNHEPNQATGDSLCSIVSENTVFVVWNTS